MTPRSPKPTIFYLLVYRYISLYPIKKATKKIMMKKQDDRVDEEFGKKSHTKKNVTK